MINSILEECIANELKLIPNRMKQMAKKKTEIGLIAIDNGVTGRYAIRVGDKVVFEKIPIFKQQEYTKKKQNVSRLNVPKLAKDVYSVIKNTSTVIIMLERPMINPRRYKASMSAIRCLEATLVCIEFLHRRHGNVFYFFIDSKEWQSAMIPNATGASKAKALSLKSASRDYGLLHYPQFGKELLRSTIDGDALAMVDYLYHLSPRLDITQLLIPYHETRR